MNTVDVIYPAWPALLYLNPLMGRYLLEPLFLYQATGQYPNKFAVHDLGERNSTGSRQSSDYVLGAHYPLAHGHKDGKDENMPVEGRFICCIEAYRLITVF
jgi:hypothetical protein